MKYRLFRFIEKLQHTLAIAKIAWKFYPWQNEEVRQMVTYFYQELHAPVAAHMLNQWNLISKSESMSSKREYHKITQTFYGDF